MSCSVGRSTRRPAGRRESSFAFMCAVGGQGSCLVTTGGLKDAWLEGKDGMASSCSYRPTDASVKAPRLHRACAACMSTECFRTPLIRPNPCRAATLARDKAAARRRASYLHWLGCSPPVCWTPYSWEAPYWVAVQPGVPTQEPSRMDSARDRDTQALWFRSISMSSRAQGQRASVYARRRAAGAPHGYSRSRGVSGRSVVATGTQAS